LSKTQSIEEVRKIIAETLKGIVFGAAHEGRSGRVKTRMARNLEQQLTDAQQVAMGMTTPVAQATGASCSCSTTASRRSHPKTWCASPKPIFKDSNLTVGVFIPDAAPDRAAGARGPRRWRPFSITSRAALQSRAPRSSTHTGEY
jgi:zinc protease